MRITVELVDEGEVSPYLAGELAAGDVRPEAGKPAPAVPRWHGAVVFRVWRPTRDDGYAAA